MAGDKQEICAGRTLKDLYLDLYGHGSVGVQTDGQEVNPDA